MLKPDARKVLEAAAIVACLAATAIGEEPFAFRARYDVVHEPDRRERGVLPTADEFAFEDGVRIGFADGTSPTGLVRRAAMDFRDYLMTSMGVAATVDDEAADGIGKDVCIAIGAEAPSRGYFADVTAKGVRICASDERMAAQALYWLEDTMNLRRAPFLKFGRTMRRPLFSPRMTHSGWGYDEFSDAYLDRLAHFGFDAVLVYVGSAANPLREKVQGVIRRAGERGLDTYLYSTVNKRAFVHPDDPKSDQVFADTYGNIAAAYRGAKGIVFVGESAQFPSKDERTCGLGIDYTKEVRPSGDRRPFPGFFPCRDYPDWLNAVRRALHRENPALETVFWSYNWGNHPEGPRRELISRLPKDVSLLVTFEMFESYTMRNGNVGNVGDYSIAFPGPGRYFASEADEAHRRGLRLYAMSNTGGRTWDLGMAPYYPVPYQWKKRWDALKAAQTKWGLSGLMESHHYGWTPSFVSELCKEAFWEGGLEFDRHLRLIAVRDFGEANAERVLSAWREWSEAISDSNPLALNQYTVYRYGPAYPFNALRPDVTAADLSKPPMFVWPNYRSRGYVAANQPDTLRRECDLLDTVVSRFADGARAFYDIAETSAGARREKALAAARLGDYIARSFLTAVNVKRGFDCERTAKSAKASAAERTRARAEVERLARAEYDNAKAALKLVTDDSSLGYEPRMGYRGDPPAIEAKLRWMERHYGIQPH